MPERLELTKNVLFFKSDDSFDDLIIDEILKLAIDNKEDNTKFIIDTFREQKKHKQILITLYQLKFFQQLDLFIF